MQFRIPVLSMRAAVFTVLTRAVAMSSCRDKKNDGCQNVERTGVAKELESSSFPHEDTGGDRPTVQSKAKVQVSCFGTQGPFQLACYGSQLHSALQGKAGHDDRMVVLGIRESRHRHIAVPNGFDLKRKRPACGLDPALTAPTQCLGKHRD